MSSQPEPISEVEVPTNPEGTWAMTSNYGVLAAVFMGAGIYENGVVTLFVKGKRKGKTNAIRMEADALDRFCAAWLARPKADATPAEEVAGGTTEVSTQST